MYISKLTTETYLTTDSGTQKAIRDKFKQYFNRLGPVSWQENMITLAANDLSEEE